MSVTYQHNGKDITPTELSTLVLKDLKRIAELEVGEIEKAVVTIPANFGNDQRDATMEAAKKAAKKTGMPMKNKYMKKK